jgi:hypothetical protein
LHSLFFASASIPRHKFALQDESGFGRNLREILTILAAVVVVVLTAALAIPPFIDWTAHAQALAGRISAVLGTPTSIGGPVVLRLLPAPRLDVGHLSIAGNGITVEAEAAHFEVAPAPLMRGIVTLTSASLDRARIVVVGDTARLPSTDARVAVDRLSLRDASFELDGQGISRRLDHVDLVASADSLAGPFKAEGFFRAGARLVPFRLATGMIEKGALDVKASADPLAGLPNAEAAGTLTWRAGPRFEGSATLAGEIAQAGRTPGISMPWQATLKGSAGAHDIDLAQVDLRAGEEGAVLAARGTGKLSDNGMTLSLASERPDFDRFLARYDRAVVFGVLVALRQGSAAIDWHAADSIVGQAVVSDASLSLTASNGGDPKMALSGRLGESRASFEGTLAASSPLRARGRALLESRDVRGLQRWLATMLQTAPGAALPLESVDASADLSIAPEHIEAANIAATLDRSKIAGRVSLTPASPGVTARLAADLASPALEIDSLPDLAALRETAAGLDVALSLDARAIRIGRVGNAAVEAGHIGLSLSRRGGEVTLESLSLANIGGATANARGRMGKDGAHVELSLNADRLGELAALARRVAPAAVPDFFARHAPMFSPARIQATIETTAKDAHQIFTRLDLSAKAADTNVTVELAPEPGKTDALNGRVMLDAPEAAALLRQFGLSVLPLRGQGGGHVEARLAGRIGEPLATHADLRLASTALSFEGTARLDVDTPDIAGRVTASAADVAPLLRILGMPVADPLARWPLEARADLALSPGTFRLDALDAHVGGLAVGGHLRRDASAAVTGALDIDRADVSALASLMLGAPQPPAAGQLLSPLTFSAQPNDPPDLSIDLTARRFALSSGLVATDMRGRFDAGPGRVGLAGARMRVAGGTLSGDATLRREGGTASLVADLSAKDIAFDLPFARGSMTASLSARGAGTSAAGLVGSLAGTGHARFAPFSLARADPAAPARVAADVDAERLDMNPRAIAAALAREADRAPQNFAAIETPLSLEAGRIAVVPLSVASGATRAILSGRLDLAADRLDLRETFAPAIDESGTNVPLAYVWSGKADDPSRNIESADLIRVLADHAIVREQARIAAQEADQRERIFFSRRLKFDRALDAARKAEAARQEAARLDALTQEAARLEALHKDALRQEAQHQDAAKREQGGVQSDAQAPPRVRPPSIPLPPGPRPLDLHPR